MTSWRAQGHLPSMKCCKTCSWKCLISSSKHCGTRLTWSLLRQNAVWNNQCEIVGSEFHSGVLPHASLNMGQNLLQKRTKRKEKRVKDKKLKSFAPICQRLSGFRRTVTYTRGQSSLLFKHDTDRLPLFGVIRIPWVLYPRAVVFDVGVIRRHARLVRT